ncbi:MAG: hypothetical protein FWH23_07520 [Bacteroidales bacterium]|nr:hypothetical protein [Bacteroidales bacterium]
MCPRLRQAARTFTALESLALDGNNLTGTIPDDLGDLPKLSELWLAQNQLTGTVPNSLLHNVHWSVWKDDVCPQQGVGFSNCSESPTPSNIMKIKKSAIAEQVKEKYRKK